MPAQSEKQAIAARIARGIQKGEVKPKAGTASAEMAKMDPSSLKHFTKMEEATKPVISPEALKKVVEYLAKEAEDFQNYADAGASYDVEFSTISDIIKDSRNNKLQKFWRSLSDKQQMEIYDMIHQYLLNKEIKNDPEYFGAQKAQPINYVLTPRTTSIAPKGDALGKMVDKLARDAESWMNYLGVDSPEQIDFTDFVDYVIQDPKTNPRIKNYWNSLRGNQQEALFKKVVSVIEKKYGSDDEMYENISLSKMAKKVIKENKSSPLMLNGKEVDKESIELDGVDPRDYPDFSDAYISDASYVDGTRLSAQDIEKLEKENYGLVNDLAHGQFF
jgi:ABC-type transporter MlaC component